MTLSTLILARCVTTGILESCRICSFERSCMVKRPNICTMRFSSCSYTTLPRMRSIQYSRIGEGCCMMREGVTQRFTGFCQWGSKSFQVP